MWLLIAVGLLILWGLSSSGEKAQNSAHYSRIKEEGTFDPLVIGLDKHFIQDFNENWVEKRYVPEKYVPYIAEVLDLEHPYETLLYTFDHRDEETGETIYRHEPCILDTRRSFPQCWANEQLSSMGFKPEHVYEYNRFEYNPYASFFFDLDRERLRLQRVHDERIVFLKELSVRLNTDFSESLNHEHEMKSRFPKPTDPIVTEYGIQLRDAYLNKIQNGRFAKAVDTVEDLAGFWVWAFERMGAKKIEEYDVSYCFRDDERGIRITGMELKPVVMKCYHKIVEPDKRNLWNNEHEGELYDAGLSVNDDCRIKPAAAPSVSEDQNGRNEALFLLAFFGTFGLLIAWMQKSGDVMGLHAASVGDIVVFVIISVLLIVSLVFCVLSAALSGRGKKKKRDSLESAETDNDSDDSNSQS